MSALRVNRLTGPPAPLRDGSGRVVAARCHRAATARARLIGLLFTPDLAADEALWLEPCASVHTAALRAPIGCAFLDARRASAAGGQPPPRWRVAAARGARAVVECRAGALAGVAPGQRLELAA